jgi:hypothetical protein
MTQSLIAALACLAAVVVAVVDGRASVRTAAVVSGLVLAPAAGSVGGTPAALVPLVAGLSAAVAGTAAQAAAERLRALPGLDPRVPVVVPRQGLFGPRSVRLFAAAVALPTASWASLNVTVGGAAVASGAVFATAYLWLVAVVRLLRARSLEELAVGGATVSLAMATGWLLQAGPGARPAAAATAAFAPVAAASAGWMLGRHHRRAVEAAA